MTQTQLNFQTDLARVTSNIGQQVLAYLESVGVGGEFTTSGLYLHCLNESEHLAPGSSCRVMRDLRKAGQIQYEVVNRSQGKYRLVGGFTNSATKESK